MSNPICQPAALGVTDCLSTERVPHEFADFREYGSSLALWAGALGDVGCDDNGQLAGRPKDSDVIARMLAIRTRFVGYAPARGQLRPQAIKAGEVRLHPPRELVARGPREHVSQQHRVQITSHGRGRRCITRIAGKRFVQGRLRSVETRHGIPQGSGEACDSGRPADRFEQKIGCRVIASGQNGVTESRDSHRAPGVRFSQRRVEQQRLRRNPDSASESFLMTVHALQNRGSE